MKRRTLKTEKLLSGAYRCPRYVLLFTLGKLTEKGNFAGRPGGFQKIYVIFSYVPFLLPTHPLPENRLLCFLFKIGSLRKAFEKALRT